MSGKRAKKRADLLLVDRGLAETLERAQALIMEGLVHTPLEKVLKPGAALPIDAPLEVRGRLPYVSRGGIKLAHALERFGLDVSGMVALDVGASTGGFTDCLLQHGAVKVFALDVGHNQIDYGLRRDPRVQVIEGVNARYPFTLPSPESSTAPSYGGELFSPMVDLATVDVSFISVSKIIPSVGQRLIEGGRMVVLVKPQFEARREEVGRGGVVKDPAVHAKVLARVIVRVVEERIRFQNLTPSPILGDAGNREFFILLKK